MKKQILTAFFLIFTVAISMAQDKVFHLTEAEKKWSYAQAVRSGNTLYISGTVGRGNMDKAVQHVYTSLQKTLQYYNINFKHVVKENLYTTDMEAMKKSQHIRKGFYEEHTPAATWVQVERLFTPEDVLEVELIAEIKKTK